MRLVRLVAVVVATVLLALPASRPTELAAQAACTLTPNFQALHDQIVCLLGLSLPVQPIPRRQQVPRELLPPGGEVRESLLFKGEAGQVGDMGQ